MRSVVSAGTQSTLRSLHLRGDEQDDAVKDHANRFCSEDWSSSKEISTEALPMSAGDRVRLMRQVLTAGGAWWQGSTEPEVRNWVTLMLRFGVSLNPVGSLARIASLSPDRSRRQTNIVN